ncbi:T9SS type B sorting domain-containing protein [Xanthomarina sp.]|nr:T9SS type B sorting domain-containing protein [Xanthomarina sp.]
MVKQINPLGTGWDGTFNGNPLPADDYWFSATLQDGREFQSHFSLKR